MRMHMYMCSHGHICVYMCVCENCFSLYLSPVNEYWKLYGYSKFNPFPLSFLKTITAKMMYVYASLFRLELSLAHGTFHQPSVVLFSFFQIKDYWFISPYEMNTLRRYALPCLKISHL